MKEIYSSATKIVLLLLAFTLSLLVISITIYNIWNEKIISDMINLFSTICISVVSFYFWQKTNTNNNSNIENKNDTKI